MIRREFLHTAALGVAAANAAAVKGNEQREPLPKRQSRPHPDLGSHWKTFETLSARCQASMSFLNEEFQDAQDWSQKTREVLQSEMHYAPPACDPSAKVLNTVDRGSFIREYIEIDVSPGIRIPVYVLVPKNRDGPAPAVVALHDHGGFYFWGKEKVVDVTPEHSELTQFKHKYYAGHSVADELAKRGYVVIAADMFHWGERGLYLEDDPERISSRTQAVTHQDILEFNARSWEHEELIGRTAFTCGLTWSGMIAFEDMRVTDYLLSRPEVDPQRVGCLGLSLGAVRTIFLGALHPAVRASVAVCWMAQYQAMARNNIRYGIGFTKIVPGLYGKLDWPDLAGLHWPGALMTINGLQDQLYPLEAAQGAVAKIKQIFQKMGASDQYKGVFFDGPHEFNAEMQGRAFAWLDRQLKVG